MVYPEIRIKRIDELYEDNAKIVASLISKDMSEAEESLLRSISERLEEDIADTHEIVSQVLEYLEEKGLDVHSYL